MTIWLGILGLVLGAVLGSFACVLALRLAKNQDALRGRSRCDNCARQLAWWENIPLVAYPILKGKCRTCHAQIDPIHIVAETLGAIILSLVLMLTPYPKSLALGAMSMLLLLLSLIDHKTTRLPDVYVVMVAILAVILAVIDDRVVEGMIACVTSGLVLLGLKHIMEKKNKAPALGLGDIKLICALSLWLGVRTPFVLALASILGLGFAYLKHGRRAKAQRFAFGPMIAASTVVIGLMPMEIWP